MPRDAKKFLSSPNDSPTSLASSSSSSSSSSSLTAQAEPGAAQKPWTGPPWRYVFLISFVAAIFLRGQVYIAETLAGTRPVRAGTARDARTDFGLSFLFDYSNAAEWTGCAAVIASRLKDIGDAGRLWVRHSHVGSNFDRPRPTSKANASTDGGWWTFWGGGSDDTENEEDDRYACRCQEPEVYEPGIRPKISAIIHSQDRAEDILNVTLQLRTADSGIGEIIVADPGSTDGSLYVWKKILSGDSDLLVRGNSDEADDFESGSVLDKAIRMADGNILLFVSRARNDGGKWLSDAKRLFEAHPDLGVLTSGGTNGARQIDCANKQDFDGKRCGQTNITMNYVECGVAADDGPLFVRKDIVRKVRKAHPNDCGMSYLAWAAGFTVAAYHAPAAPRASTQRKGKNAKWRDVMRVKAEQRAREVGDEEFERRFVLETIREGVEQLNNNTLAIDV